MNLLNFTYSLFSNNKNETVKAAGTTDAPKRMKAEDIPEDVRTCKGKYDSGGQCRSFRKDFCEFIHEVGNVNFLNAWSIN